MVLFQFRATDTRQLQIDGLCVFLCCVYIKDKNKIYIYTAPFNLYVSPKNLKRKPGPITLDSLCCVGVIPVIVEGNA
jgi:hypothetical protein